jgi:hypothetical protein
MWNWRMLLLTGLPQYADVMELALYNAVLPGLSLDGTRYFYENPLADRGKHRRQEWFGCACCPPNVARLLASLPGYAYAVGDDGAFVNLYASSRATLALPSGERVELRQETDYPWSGDVTIHVDEAPGDEFALNLRVPFWADEADAQLFVNDVDATELLGGAPGYYRAVKRAWKAGDTVRLVLPMPVEHIESHPHVTSNRGRIALQRGPLVYCIEHADNPGADAWDLALPDDPSFKLERLDIAGHTVIALKTDALARSMEDWSGALYAPYAAENADDFAPATLTAIPYYAWANREAGPMQVWIPVVSEP